MGRKATSTFESSTLDEIMKDRRSPIEWSWYITEYDKIFVAEAKYAAMSGKKEFYKGTKTFVFDRAEVESIKVKSLEDLNGGQLFLKCNFVGLLTRKSKDFDKGTEERLKAELLRLKEQYSLETALKELENTFKSKTAYDERLRAAGLLMAKVKQVNGSSRLGWIKEGEEIMSSYIN
ncbi:hypothetical protein IKF20_00330 [Candidatus Saccharibacteria bacterium]|nr:hypothetical protein [Candidatus Saccharibacteria bacterium]